jgi:hypothetical protein
MSIDVSNVFTHHRAVSQNCSAFGSKTVRSYRGIPLHQDCCSHNFTSPLRLSLASSDPNHLAIILDFSGQPTLRDAPLFIGTVPGDGGGQNQTSRVLLPPRELRHSESERMAFGWIDFGADWREERERLLRALETT